MIKIRVNFLALTALIATYFTLVMNVTLFQHFYQILSGLPDKNYGFIITLPFVLFFALLFLFLPFSLKHIMKPFFIILLLLSSVVSYAMMKYNVVFDKTMIENIFETNTAEATSYLSPALLFWVAGSGVAPSVLLLFSRIDYPSSIYYRTGGRILIMLVSALFVGLIAFFYYKDYAFIGRNNHTLNQEIVPASYLYSAGKYINRRYLTSPIPFQKVGEDAQVSRENSRRPNLVIVLLGETARAQNQSLGGYSRPTNEFTAGEPGLFYFRHVTSCGTSTAVSVPCMFSAMTRQGFDDAIARHSDSVMDIMQRAGVATFWLDNDEGCKGACDRIAHDIVRPDSDSALCDGNTCYDEVMLKNIESKIPDDNKDKLLVFHLIGSHGPAYYQRYPQRFRHFLPACERNDIQNCSRQELLNTYDNTLRYTDYVVDAYIKKLKSYANYNVALLYVSDHGESLGEQGIYLHGSPYKIAPEGQTHVPLLLWLSPDYMASQGINGQCLQKAAREQAFSHDNVFHTLLSMLNVRTQVYDRGLDILAPCKK
ncbi:phosphoethanolamine transferase [Affinibrenneria salicis]|uniref:phosphoethanolamine transferase n=1 Tax=Affinibrenneria salicis TaxID=2590031 RepID=UPI00295F0F4F|nr:phosphoethanolamine--lipid A transferase [Affinibrenneria salicis]